jgi:hypothetical protein
VGLAEPSGPSNALVFKIPERKKDPYEIEARNIQRKLAISAAAAAASSTHSDEGAEKRGPATLLNIASSSNQKSEATSRLELDKVRIASQQRTSNSAFSFSFSFRPFVCNAFVYEHSFVF